MSAIGTANWCSCDVAALLFANPSDTFQNPGGIAAPDASDSSPSGGRDPATRVELSDKVKAILARAKSDQDVADRLKAFVASHRISGDDGASQDSSSASEGSKLDVEAAFEQLSGGTQANDGSQDDPPVQVVKSFATGLKADGYTISALASETDGSSRIVIFGPNGTSFLDERLGTTGEVSGFSNLGVGVTALEYQHGNQEYITFSQSTAAATSVSASSDTDTVSATSSGTRTASVTFVVDFNTGAISMTQSEAISVSTTAQISQAGSSFSTLA